MRSLLLAGLALLPASPGRAATTITSDQQVTGQMGVGTQVPQARLEAREASSDSHALKVSSQNGSPLLWVDSEGKAGLGLASPQANLDLDGRGDDGSVGLLLRVGNSSESYSSSQLVFASTEGLHRHSIASRANPAGNAANALEFFLFHSTGDPSALGTERALSLVSSTTAGSGSLHVRPFGTPDVELEVSDGLSTGGGTLHRDDVLSPSSRELKTDIEALGPDAEAAAARDVKALRHAAFRYRRPPGSPPGPLLRGLIYEDAPESVRGPGETVVVNERVANLELALKAAYRRLEELRAKVDAAKRGRGR